eukprot:5911396-Pleurochrysis_carterae.AAC.1
MEDKLPHAIEARAVLHERLQLSRPGRPALPCSAAVGRREHGRHGVHLAGEYGAELLVELVRVDAAAAGAKENDVAREAPPANGRERRGRERKKETESESEREREGARERGSERERERERGERESERGSQREGARGSERK